MMNSQKNRAKNRVANANANMARAANANMARAAAANANASRALAGGMAKHKSSFTAAAAATKKASVLQNKALHANVAAANATQAANRMMQRARA